MRPRSGPGIRFLRRSWWWPIAEFQPEITLSKDEALDLVAGCDEVLSFAEASGELELGFTVEGMRRLVLGRLLRDAGGD